MECMHCGPVNDLRFGLVWFLQLVGKGHDILEGHQLLAGAHLFPRTVVGPYTEQHTGVVHNMMKNQYVNQLRVGAGVVDVGVAGVGVAARICCSRLRCCLCCIQKMRYLMSRRLQLWRLKREVSYLVGW